MKMLKRSEHIARAMLMGLVYNWHYGYYHTPIGVRPRKRYDALSLERITNSDEVRNRQAHWGAGNGTRPYYSEAPEDD